MQPLVGVSLTLSELLQGEGGDGEAPLQEVGSHLLVAAHLGAVDPVDQAAVSRRQHHREGQDVQRGVQVETVQDGRSQLPHPALLHLQEVENKSNSTTTHQKTKLLDGGKTQRQLVIL